MGFLISNVHKTKQKKSFFRSNWHPEFGMRAGDRIWILTRCAETQTSNMLYFSEMISSVSEQIFFALSQWRGNGLLLSAVIAVVVVLAFPCSCPALGAQLGVIYPPRSCDEHSSAPISFVPGVKKAAVPGTDSSSPCAHHTGKEPQQLAPRLWAEAAKLLRPWPRFATCQTKAKCCRMIKQEPWTVARFIGHGNERWWFGTSLTRHVWHSMNNFIWRKEAHQSL